MAPRRNQGGGGGGNNRGGGGGGNRGGNDRSRRRMFARARSDIGLSQRPFLNQLDRAATGAENVYSGVGQELKGMQGNYAKDSAGIAAGLQDQLAGLTGLLGGDLPAGELTAGNGVFGQLGAGGLERLASTEQRNLGYQDSAQREALLSGRTAQDNLIQQRNQVFEQRPALIRQRVDELREQRLQNMMVKSALEGDDAFADLVANLVGRSLADDKSGNNRPNRPNTPRGNRRTNGAGHRARQNPRHNS